MTLPLFPTAIATLRRASERLQAWPTSTLWLACLACLPEGDTLTCAEIDEVLQARSLHDLQGAEAVEALQSLLRDSEDSAAEQPGATVPASQSPFGEPESTTPEEHLCRALEHLEAAIKGFEPGPGTYRLEFAAQDLSAVLKACGLARSPEAEKAAEAALWKRHTIGSPARSNGSVTSDTRSGSSWTKPRRRLRGWENSPPR